MDSVLFTRVTVEGSALPSRPSSRGSSADRRGPGAEPPLFLLFMATNSIVDVDHGDETKGDRDRPPAGARTHRDDRPRPAAPPGGDQQPESDGPQAGGLPT